MFMFIQWATVTWFLIFRLLEYRITGVRVLSLETRSTYFRFKVHPRIADRSILRTFGAP